jgi:hypothetical protein
VSAQPSLSPEELGRLLIAVVSQAYRATGVSDGCSYLLCTVSTGPLELDVMEAYPDCRDERGLRTKAALKDLLQKRGLWETEFVKPVLRPNARDAARYARQARRSLRQLSFPDLVIDPAALDVRQLGLDLVPPMDVEFPREAYLEINGRLWDSVRCVVVCPNAEYGGGGGSMRSNLLRAIKKDVALIEPDGSPLSPGELGARVHNARLDMSSRGFSPDEIDAYMPPWPSET